MIREISGIRANFTPGRPQKPVRDENYKRFVKSLPSAVSGRYGCDPCHTGPHGTGQKSSDLSVIPLTRTEHREFDKNPRAFVDKWGLDIPTTVARLNRAYELKTKGRAA